MFFDVGEFLKSMNSDEKSKQNFCKFYYYYNFNITSLFKSN